MLFKHSFFAAFAMFLVASAAPVNQPTQDTSSGAGPSTAGPSGTSSSTSNQVPSGKTIDLSSFNQKQNGYNTLMPYLSGTPEEMNKQLADIIKDNKVQAKWGKATYAVNEAFPGQTRNSEITLPVTEANYIPVESGQYTPGYIKFRVHREAGDMWFATSPHFSPPRYLSSFEKDYLNWKPGLVDKTIDKVGAGARKVQDVAKGWVGKVTSKTRDSNAGGA